jgi:hypothetical protein
MLREAFGCPSGARAPPTQRQSQRRPKPFATPLRICEAHEGEPHQILAFRMPQAFGAWLQVGDERLNSIEIQRIESVFQP